MYICSECLETKKKCRCHRDKVIHRWADDNGLERVQVEWLGPEFVWVPPKPFTDENPTYEKF